MRLRDRLDLILIKLEEEEESSYRANVAFLGTKLEAGINRLRRTMSSLTIRARIALACVAAGMTTVLLSLTVAEIAAVGSGYFLRFGILLLGIGLVQLLRK